MDRLDDVYITDIAYLLDVLQLLGLFTIARGLGRVFGGLGGGMQVEFVSEKKIPLRNVPGVLKRKKKWGGGDKVFFPTNFAICLEIHP